MFDDQQVFFSSGKSAISLRTWTAQLNEALNLERREGGLHYWKYYGPKLLNGTLVSEIRAIRDLSKRHVTGQWRVCGRGAQEIPLIIWISRSENYDRMAITFPTSQRG